ncbi:MAG TPA: pyridoxal phosphate-dependent aminotransferase [Longimicrobiaceae bacterium]|nr:pyridoxal phosphate-dependent aminotransferase [Longimicrobiaceae bacterium]
MNPILADIPPSLIRAINARKQPGDIDLCMGEPTLRPDPASFEAATAWVRERGCPYTQNAGWDELREAIAAYYDLPGAPGGAGVCITIGSQEALYLAIKTVVDPARDEVLVVEPAYLAYTKLCMLEGIRHRTVALAAEDGFAPRASAVLEAMRSDTRLVVIASPCNPTGRVWPEAELRALAAGLAERSGPPVYVLSDEVYRELYYTPRPPATLARFHPHTLIAGSLSKSNALTGLRLGWLVGPPEVVAAAIKVHQFVNTAASTFSQLVALELFRDPVSLAAHRPLYARSREALLAAAERHGVPHLPPEGAFYCLLRLPEWLAGDSLDAVGRLLEARRVVAVPGIAFGSSAEGWLRISWVVSDALLDEAMRRIGEFFRENG